MTIQSGFMHKAIFIPGTIRFEAFFNVPTPGRYDFLNTALCQNVQLIELRPGTIYWIRGLSVGGNIPEYDYSGSIVDFPNLTIRRSLRNESVYRFPVPINRYYEEIPCEAWIKSDVREEVMTLSLSGSSIQLPTMVGVPSIILNISLFIFSFTDKSFSIDFDNRVIR